MEETTVEYTYLPSLMPNSDLVVVIKYKVDIFVQRFVFSNMYSHKFSIGEFHVKNVIFYTSTDFLYLMLELY